MRALVLALTFALAATTLPPGLAEPTPGLNASLERIVPEAWETNDYIGYEEGRAYLEAIAAAAPDLVEVVDVADSVGWDNLAGGHDTFKNFAVEVTNERSPVPREQKQALVFQLSIHGNEKGGREGGFRVIEDLAVPRLYGQDYRALLDDHVVVFTFPNVDGWRHEEAAYLVTNCRGGGLVNAPLPADAPCAPTQGYVRGNGHGQDLNRDWPTTGWYQTRFGRESALSEPEMAGMAAYLEQFRGRTIAASDIHGMLTPADGGVTAAGSLPVPFLGGDGGNGPRSLCVPENPSGFECAAKEGHFVLGMVRGYQADALDMLRDVALSQGSQEALQAMADARFPYWGALPNAGVAGGRFMEYGTVWDTLGYSDSGFTGLWLAETLGAAGVDYEMSYNHVTFDDHYVPEVNAIHVESVRTIVRTYLDAAEAALVPRLTPAATIAWLDDPRDTSSVPPAEQPGAHLNSTADDAYEVASQANPQHFWRDLARYAPAGSIAPITAADLAAGRLQAHSLVITGQAWDSVAGNPQAVAAIRGHVQGGGQLFLTDSALRGLEALGLAQPGSVEQGQGYMGYVDLDLESPLAKGVRPLAHQTYEGIPLGYEIPEASPTWTVAAQAFDGEVLGTTFGPDRVSAGTAQLGQGQVVFLGALLPPATNTGYHPYGLADYAVSATGYTLVYNILGLAQDAVEGGALDALAGPGPAQPQGIPGFEVWAALMAVGALAAALPRRRP